MTTNEKTQKGKCKIGLRTYKTALAVFLCLFVTYFLGSSGTLLAAIAAILCMRETHKDSLKIGLDRMIGTITGGILAFVYLMILKQLPINEDLVSKIIIPIFIIICIYVCNLFNVKGASGICCIVFLIVAIGREEGTRLEILSYVGIRELATLIGEVIATVINKYIAPYHTE